jgi:hypothetical protein
MRQDASHEFRSCSGGDPVPLERPAVGQRDGRRHDFLRVETAREG